MELQRRVADLAAAGYATLVVTPDPVEALAAFAAERAIGYSLLSDAGSDVIRRVGVLNTLIAPDEPDYGLPFPGLFVTDARGVVTHKVFHRRYQERETADALLYGVIGLQLDMSANPSATADAEVSAVLGAAALGFGQWTELYVRIALGPGEHVYGPDVPSGYVATTVAVTAPEGIVVGSPRYPHTRPFAIAGLDEQFEVIEPPAQGAVEIAVPLLSRLPEAPDASAAVTLTVDVGYQVCTDVECFLPQRRQLLVTVPVRRLDRSAPHP